MAFKFIDIFTMLFVTMGPFKVVLIYAQVARNLEPKMRRKLAVRAVLIAFVVGTFFILSGKFLLDLFHFSPAALSIAGGIILFVFAINMVLSKGEDESVDEVPENPMSMAAFPLAMPLMATPIGIVAVATLSVTYDKDNGALLLTVIALALVMLINLLVLLGESRFVRVINPQVIGVAERVLGILLAALAVQTIFNGMVEIIATLQKAPH
jgi:multiple antibiotic resistance protein